MSAASGEVDSLAQGMVDLAARGMTLVQISAKVGLDVPVIHERMAKYLEDQATSMSVVQMRMLQLRRLERILDAIDDQVMGGDLLTQGRNVKNLIETIREITDLMDLKKDRLRDEQVRLTQAQTALVLRSLGVPQTVLLAELLSAWIAEERADEFREYWNTRFPELAAQGVEENHEALVQVGGGVSGPVELRPVPRNEEW
jgi:hypothetical protein